MRTWTAVLLLTFAGCGSSTPAAPPVPTPPPIPNMIGGWGGTENETYVSLDGSVTGARTCSENWLITSQTGGAFSGAYQRVPGSDKGCALSGSINGSVLTGGTIQFAHGDEGTTGSCTFLSGDVQSQGVLSASGNITAGEIAVVRCPFGRGTIDVRFTIGFTLSRR